MSYILKTVPTKQKERSFVNVLVLYMNQPHKNILNSPLIAITGRYGFVLAELAAVSLLRAG